MRDNWSHKNHNPATLFQQLVSEGVRNIWLINNWPHYIKKWSGPGVPYEAHPQWPVVNINGPYWPWKPVPSSIPSHHPGLPEGGVVVISKGPIGQSVPRNGGRGPPGGNRRRNARQGGNNQFGRNNYQVGMSPQQAYGVGMSPQQVYGGNRRNVMVAGQQVAPMNYYQPPMQPPQMHAGPFMGPLGNQFVGPVPYYPPPMQVPAIMPAGSFVAAPVAQPNYPVVVQPNYHAVAPPTMQPNYQVAPVVQPNYQVAPVQPNYSVVQMQPNIVKFTVTEKPAISIRFAGYFNPQLLP